MKTYDKYFLPSTPDQASTNNLILPDQPEERVPIIFPDGDLGSVGISQYESSLKKGFQPDTPFNRAVAEYVKENNNLLGSLKVGGGQFVDELAFGLPELIYDKTADPFDVAKKEALKAAHPTANTIGGVTGFAGSLAAGSPLFKGATSLGTKASTIVGSKVGSRAVVKAAQLGVEGAAISSPRALTELVLGDPEQAVETLLIGGGLGAGLGFVFPFRSNSGY